MPRRSLFFAIAFSIIIIASATSEKQPPNSPPGIASTARPEDETGFVPIFDGKTLQGWDGAPGFWDVEDGAIVGRSTPAHPSGVTFLIWTGGEPANFELRLQIKLGGGISANSGIQYRSHRAPYPVMRVPAGGAPRASFPGGGNINNLFKPALAHWNMAGYQFDFAPGLIGGFYEEGGPLYRGYLAIPGQAIYLQSGKPATLIGTTGPASLFAGMKPDQWSDIDLIARGDTLIQIVNGHVVTMAIDDDAKRRARKGLIGLQLETVTNCTVYARNIRLKVLPPSN